MINRRGGPSGGPKLYGRGPPGRSVPAGRSAPRRAAGSAPGTAAPTAPGFEVARLPLGKELDLTQWVAPDLGNSSYLLSFPDSRTVVVVDPLRDVDGYLSYLGPLRARQVLVLETHIHNDFVSGSRALARAVGAQVVTSADAELGFPHRGLADGASLSLGDFRVQVLATPGHTPEHVSYLLYDPEDRPRALFSGGALIIGGASRTDLLGVAQARPLAHQLYGALRQKIAPLPGDVRLLPTHGGGSFCSAVEDGARSGTLRTERASNPLLRARDEEEFVERILAQNPYPSYFRRMRALNSAGTEPAPDAPPRPRALPLDRFDRSRTEGAVVVDTRAPESFDAGHVPGSLSVGEDGSLSAWVGWLLPPDRPLLLLSRDEEEAASASRQLFRIGYDGVQGFLAGGFPAWKEAGRPVAHHPRIDAEELRRRLKAAAPSVVLDVREAHEWAQGHIPGSLNIPVAALAARASEVPRGVPVYVHCAHGYRSSIASSLLEQAGFDQVVRISDGFERWENLSSRPARRSAGA